MKRRTLFKGLLGGAAFGAAAPAMRLFADVPENFRFVSLYVSGGWDVLVGLDARERGFDTDGLNTHYDAITDESLRQPHQMRIGDSEPVYFGRGLESLWTGDAPHTDLMTVFRSVNMNTVAHAAGRAYMNTFRRPAGVVPRGSSLSTMFATAGSVPESMYIPNVSIGLPSFNIEYPSQFTAVRVNRSNEFAQLFSASGRLDPATEELLRTAQHASTSCVSRNYQRTRPSAEVRNNRDRVARLLEDDLSARFDVRNNDELKTLFGLSDSEANSSTHASTVAAVIYQLLAQGITRSVSSTIQTGLDTHNSNWTTLQAQRQQLAWEAIGKLLTALRQDDPRMERTALMVHSEFARTPKINGSGGRDHWFANSIAVFSGLLRPGVVGRTGQDDLSLKNTNLVTGEADSSGTMLTPELVAATVAEAAGLGASPFRVDPLRSWIL